MEDLLAKDDVTPEQAQALGTAVARRLKAKNAPPFRNRRQRAKGFEGVNSQEEFNEQMALLYNDADRERIWIA